MSKNYRKLTDQIISLVGGKENIKSVTNCATRLRLVLKDTTKYNKEIIENIESFNKDIVSWGHRTRQTILGKIPKGRHASGAKEEPLARSFRMNTSKTFGEIDRIGFSFSLHGVFLQKGVGRGYISKNGVVMRGERINHSRNPKTKSTDFRTIPGVISRRKLDWFNGPLQSRFENLSDLVAEHKADQAILNFKRMKIQ